MNERTNECLMTHKQNGIKSVIKTNNHVNRPNHETSEHGRKCFI